MNTDEQEELREQIHLFIKKARRSVAASKRLLKDKDVDFAISRLYYAVFYGMEAVLLTKNITSSKHAGVISQFNQLFVKEGIFPKHFSKAINLRGHILHVVVKKDHWYKVLLPLNSSDENKICYISI